MIMQLAAIWHLLVFAVVHVSLFVISISCCFNMVSVRWNGLWYKHVLALCAF